MPNQIFVNLPVKDLPKSKEFFQKLGWSFNPQFEDETAACLVINDGSIYAMLITEPKFKEFIPKQIADSKTSAETIIALTLDSRGEVDDLVQNAMDAGASPSMPVNDMGWMYNRSFQDLDGHLWEVLYMDMEQMPKQP